MDHEANPQKKDFWNEKKTKKKGLRQKALKI